VEDAVAAGLVVLYLVVLGWEGWGWASKRARGNGILVAEESAAGGERERERERERKGFAPSLPLSLATKGQFHTRD
jgi:hypothetical protein